MKEIPAILIDKECRFVDRNLTWGARLSDYQDTFNDLDLFIGIELTLDVTTPRHFEIIIHYYEYAERPSSIEQLAKMLNIVLGRKQLLIATNDSGYIPAIIAMQASKAENAETLRLDREAQGVTEIDEPIAQESFQNNLLVIDHG